LWNVTNLPACHAKKKAAVTTSNNGRLTCDTNGGNLNRLLAIIRNLDGLTRVRSLPVDTRTIFAAPSSSASEQIRGRAGGVFGDMSEGKTSSGNRSPEASASLSPRHGNGTFIAVSRER
jgi:hypothetical protein